VRDQYSYDPRFPTEIWEGHFTLVRTGFGAEYYAWSANRAFDGKSNLGYFRGWFVALGQKFCDDDDVCRDVILPITEKRWNDEAQGPSL
jgi:hypothetical protein